MQGPTLLNEHWGDAYCKLTFDIVELIDEMLADLPEDVATFRSRYPHDYLVRRPKTIFQEETQQVSSEIEYRTVTVKPDDDGIAPWGWFLAPLCKRVGNPFPDHLSVGRAPNCDVVMRFRYVSKAHARFHLSGERAVSLEDLGSSNGTGVNRRQMPKGQRVEIQPGDKLSFGSLVVTYMQPDELYALLRYRRNSTQSPPRSSVG